MIIVRTAAELTSISTRQRSSEQHIALVPTMGALHSGHASLFDEARRHSSLVIASIFVNPLQFSDKSDLVAYPSTLESDLELCRHHGVDVVYCPELGQMYPSGFATTVHVAGLTDILEGRARSGHFDGVTTVVTKLFNAARPDVAVFGQKDFQQAAVVRRLIADLDLPIRLVVAPTVRDHDGLALSSRNVRLDTEARRLATSLWRGLAHAARNYRHGERDALQLTATVRQECAEPGIDLDYVVVVDTESLDTKSVCDERTAILVAAVIGGVRLIDNVVLGDPGS